MSKETKVLKAFAEAVQEQSVSWLTGSQLLDSRSRVSLFPRNHGPVDFPFPPLEELQTLYTVAQPAAFGRGQETVIDPTYRSGRTFVTDNFAVNLRPEELLLQQIKGLMINIENGSTQYFVRAELYRVNIYGPGDFFKEHKDTPQTGSGHFGSLVFCLPTQFEGGSFVIRDPKGEEIKFDWGSKVSVEAAGTPEINTTGESAEDEEENGNNGLHAESKKRKAMALTEENTAKKVKETGKNYMSVPFVAFASDLVHWVEPVKSGFRVTVTYHLFRELLPLSDMVMPAMNRLENAPAVAAAEAMKKSGALSNKRVVFPLTHTYSARKSDDLVLKGGDALLFQALAALKTHPKVMFFYDLNGHHERYYDDDEDSEEDSEEGETERVHIPTEKCYLTDSVEHYSERGLYEGDERVINDFAECFDVVWAGSSKRRQLLSVGGHYGNEASMEAYYGDACIVTKW